MNDKQFIETYCLNCGTQRCEGIGTEWFEGCKHKRNHDSYIDSTNLTIDEPGPTLGQEVEEINSKFTQSLAHIGIDTEGKDLLEIIAEMADKINQLQIDLDNAKHDLGMEMLFI